jgi:hypothetical protein
MQRLEIEIPQSWADIPLRKYLALQNELKSYSDNEDAIQAILLHHLCGIDAEHATHLSHTDYEMLRDELGGFMQNIELPLHRFITIDGKEYGFEPNLSNMSYGSFLDITKWDTLSIDKNWAHIMSILYRPVLNKDKYFYSIEPYNGIDRADKFLEVGMDVHFGALFFFVRLWMELLNATLNFTKITEEVPPEFKPILRRSGKVIQQYTDLLTETSQNTKKCKSYL